MRTIKRWWDKWTVGSSEVEGIKGSEMEKQEVESSMLENEMKVVSQLLVIR